MATMNPEEREGIKNLLAGHEPDEAVTAWLKRQLEADDWDKQLERMGGGKKARDAYMKPIFDTRCSVTAFDQHAQLMADGRERGLWIWLHDESKSRAEIYERWATDALELFCKLAGIEDKTREKFRLSMAMDEFKRVANAKTDEAALLEWPAVKKMYAVIGDVLKARAPKKSTPKKTVSKHHGRGKARHR